MTTAVIILSILLFFTMSALGGAAKNVKELQKQIVALDKEQHTQNKEIMELMKFRNEASAMILQHIEILQYLVEQDPKLKATRSLFETPIGEA